jgi:hypothetical protein
VARFTASPASRTPNSRANERGGCRKVKCHATVSVIATRQVGKTRTSTSRQDRLRNALKIAAGPIRWIR